MTIRGLSFVLITAASIVLAPRESQAKGLYSFISDLFSGSRRLVSFGAAGQGRLAARARPELTNHYMTGRRRLQDDFHLAHRGPMVETVQRAVRREEARWIREQKVLMKRDTSRPIYVTSYVPDSARKAQRVLALPKRPVFKTTLEVPKRAFPPLTQVPPLRRWLRTLPGGGTQSSIPGTRIVPVRPVSIQRLKK